MSTRLQLGFMVVITSWLEIVFRELSLGFTGFRSLRLVSGTTVCRTVEFSAAVCFTIGAQLSDLRSQVRPLLMVQMFSGLKAIFESLANNASGIMNVIVILTFFFTLFAVTGQQMFSGVLKPRCRTLAGDASQPEVFCNVAACPAGMVSEATLVSEGRWSVKQH